MFFDWLTVHQDHDFQLPILADRHFIAVDTASGEDLGIKQDTLQHEGSYSTSINIRISGNRVTVSGNPSRINRIENLFGLTSLDQCIAVYNKILIQYGLPPFTPCTKVWHSVGEGARINTFTDGAVFEEIHITSNLTTGAVVHDITGPQSDLFKNHDVAVDTFIRAISTLPYKNSIPRLHANGKTCDWLTKKGTGGTLIYPSVYNKAYELELHALPKIKRKFGDQSPEYQYLLNVIEYCHQHGVARFEQKLKSAFIRRNHLRFYGLFNAAKGHKFLQSVHDDFLNIHKKLQVEHMSLESITQKLISSGVCDNTKSANTTTLYAIQWMHGQQFDLNKKAVQTHRARLRQIGIDIALPCDLTKFSLVTVKSATQINVGQLVIPNWYRRPNHLQLAA